MNELQLVRKYEPILKFAKDENFFPMNVEKYVTNCFLYRVGKDKPERIPTYVTLDLLGELERVRQDNSAKYRLNYANWDIVDRKEYQRLHMSLDQQKDEMGLKDLQEILWDVYGFAEGVGIPCERIFRFFGAHDRKEVSTRAKLRYGGIDTEPPTYYYRVIEDNAGYTVIQYWFFYAYNDYGTEHGGFNDHEADWESIHLFLKDGKPSRAAYSHHFSREVCWWKPESMDVENGHPVAYIGAGSHGSYPTLEKASVEGFELGSKVVGAPGSVQWANPESLADKLWCTEFKGLWGSWEYSKNFLHRSWLKLIKRAAGPPAGPMWERNGEGQRPKWEDPAKWAGLT